MVLVHPATLKDVFMNQNELERRKWAESHQPRLTTNSQAVEMFGLKTFSGLRAVLNQSGVECYFFKQWSGTIFYDYHQTLAVADDYLIANPHLTRIEPLELEAVVVPAKQLPRYSPNRFDIPEHGWTTEQFLDQWSIDNMKSPIKDILKRAPSVYKMKSKDAYSLIRILIDPTDTSYRISGYKLDQMMFVNAIADIASDASSHKKLTEVTLLLYRTTSIGTLDPYHVVRIIYELLSTTKKTR